MEKLNLNAQTRTTEEKLSEIRAAKMIPAIVYWKNQEPIAIKVDYSEFLKLFRVSGESHIITLVIDKKKIDVLVHELQNDPVRGDYKHIDFFAVTKGEKVHTKIALEFVGESQAVKEWAILDEHMKEIDVKVLPKDLVDSIQVDLSELKEMGSNIRVSELKIDSSKFEILSNEDDIVVAAAKPAKVEEVETEAPEAPAMEDEEA